MATLKSFFQGERDPPAKPGFPRTTHFGTQVRARDERQITPLSEGRPLSDLRGK